VTVRERIAAALLEVPDAQPDEVAAWLTDEDVASGEYDGCSVDLELAFTEYLEVARELVRS
jgi:hypothetical protein